MLMSATEAESRLVAALDYVEDSLGESAEWC